LILFFLRIAEYLAKFEISLRTSAVFRRAGPSAADAPGIFYILFRAEDIFQ